ncbi:hypothetical protein [Paraburkholderia caledonica]|jgi:hypothetical protein|uniref:hypothetical protein n=1 Tax=Paraburkholderia caledonica TaxID=134536 RepID=UPI00047F1902|nr:hypothetical protein [Paraburkholderia caledonica]
MKKTIAVYWPLAIVLALAGVAYLQICGDMASRGSQAPLAADRLTAELARAVSYGMIDDTSSLPAKPLRAVTALPRPQAS